MASNIGRKDLLLNNNTSVCSLHFQSGENKYSNEVPTLKLPKTSYHKNVSKRKSPKKRVHLCVQKCSPKHKTVSVGTDLQGETMQNNRAWSKGCIIREAIEWNKGMYIFIGCNFAEWHQGAILYRVSIMKAFWNMVQISWPFSFMSPVLGVSKFLKAAWEEVWTTEKTITLRGIFLNYD